MTQFYGNNLDGATFLSAALRKTKLRIAFLPSMSYGITVKTLTIRLPEELAAELDYESIARRLSKSDIVRERLTRPSSVTASQGNSIDLIGDILKKSWEAEVPEVPRQFSSPKKQHLANLIRAKKLHR